MQIARLTSALPQIPFGTQSVWHNQTLIDTAHDQIVWHLMGQSPVLPLYKLMPVLQLQNQLITIATATDPKILAKNAVRKYPYYKEQEPTICSEFENLTRHFNDHIQNGKNCLLSDPKSLNETPKRVAWLIVMLSATNARLLARNAVNVYHPHLSQLRPQFLVEFDGFMRNVKRRFNLR